MTKIKTDVKAMTARSGERGAALITALLLSMLLLVAGGALIMTTAVGTTTAIDVSAEARAYYAAESGLQAALAVVRGNVAASPANGTQIKGNLRALNTPATVNTAGDAANNPDGNAATNDGFPRLSRYLTYNGTGLNARVVVSGDASFQLEISDPDDPNRTQLTTNPAYSPTRLVIISTGYGPRNSTKRMRMVIRKGAFDFEPPSTLTMTGNVTGFQIGNSGAKGYSGIDEAGVAGTLPMFGFTDGGSYTGVNNTTFDPSCTTQYCNKAREGTSDPPAATIPGSDLPTWLQSPSAARDFLNDLQGQAAGEGRYFATKDGAAAPTLGTSSNPRFTFVDGNLSAAGSGAGLLVVTGDLTFSGNFSFDGVILVMGSWKNASGTLQGGGFNRNGGGDGTIAGAIVVSHFDRTDPNGEFLSTSFNVNGGGNSDILFNSVKVANALNSLGSRVLGVVEF